MAQTYTAGAVEVRPSERRVLIAGEAAALGARAFDLLMALIERRDRVVGKDELMELVWPGLAVEENNLTVQISAVRKALGADAIATIAGRGYRFTLPLRDSETPTRPAPHGLPAERSSFVGREAEIATLRRQLQQHRLVTITGIGGGGKTRLALKAAELELPRFKDGVYFVDLAQVTDPQSVAQAAAQACGILAGDTPPDSPRSLARRLVAALASRQALLVMDNCEHLLDACAELVGALRAHCPELAVLATSREALALEGEQVLPVPPLALPAGEPGEQLTDAMRLFVERARAVGSGLTLDTPARQRIAEICRRLDGIPLAIEFAAARAAHLSAAEIAARLDDRLQLLGGGRGRIGRQQTLAATLDWSHDLLRQDEQAAFRRLSVCAGGFTLGLAEAVVGDEAIARADVLELMASLVAKSLITASPDEVGETRYRLLETVRMYAAEKLAAAGEEAQARARYRDACVAWLEAAPLERLLLDVGAIGAVARDIDQVRAAASTCMVDDRPDLLARLASPLVGFCLTGNWYRTALAFLEQALSRPQGLTTSQRVACHAALLPMHMLANDVDAALEHGQRGVELSCNHAGGFEVMARAYRGFARSMRASLPGAEPRLLAAAREDIDHATQQAQAMPPAWRAFIQSIAADTEINLGDHDAAARWAEASVRNCERAGSRLWVLGSALTKLTVAQHLLGRAESALATAQRALEELHVPDFSRQAMADGWRVELAPALYAGGRREVAAEVLSRGVAAMRRNGVDLAPNQLLEAAAIIEYLRGEPERSARLMGAARSAGGADQEVMAFRTPASMALYRHYLPFIRAALTPEAARAARDEGRAMTTDEAFDDALEGIVRI
ncbi:MAG TPA: winged helix-turn-helix domain-containing protein [Caulobacteraceae bacterium]|nr:winged helix-turn-helix domain-containing protein [Caulobacteraceae bacterium]